MVFFFWIFTLFCLPFILTASGVNVASGENHNQTFAFHCCPYFCSLRTNIKSTMVDYGSGPVKESIDNTVFIIPGIIVICLVCKFYFHVQHLDFCPSWYNMVS